MDCSQADNPEECVAIEQAKEKCAGKKDAALTACLNPGATKNKVQKVQKTGKSRKAMKKSLGQKSTKAAGKTIKKTKSPSVGVHKASKAHKARHRP